MILQKFLKAMSALSFLFLTLTVVFFVVSSENTDGQCFQS